MYRQQLVSVDGVQSDLMKLSYRVTQGGLLGPLLHLSYSKDMVTSVKNKLLPHADSMIICDKNPNVVAVI